LLLGSTSAQEAGSLKNLVSTTKDVESRTGIYIQLSNIYQGINIHSSLFCLNKARSLYREFHLENFRGKIGLKTELNQSASSKLKLNVDQLQPGLYSITLSDALNSTSQKLLIH